MEQTVGKPPRHGQERPHQQTATRTPNIWRNPSPISLGDDSDSDFFSPQPVTGNTTILPRSHDTSWIGARQSPIPSFDDEECGTILDDHSNETFDDSTTDHHSNDPTEKYHRALHESLRQFGFVSDGKNLNDSKPPTTQEDDESTHLLKSARHAEYSSIQDQPNDNLQNTTRVPPNFHPLWEGATSEEKRKKAKQCAKYYSKRAQNGSRSKQKKWGYYLIVLTGFNLFAMSIADLISWWNQQKGVKDLEWTAPFQARSADTLIRFGAMNVQRIIFQQEYWRLVSSWCLCGSLLEWLVVLGSWRICIYGNPTFKPRRLTWMATYIGAALVGQFWMMAYDMEASTATAATWGTAGILTSFGIDRPAQRDLCFLPTMCLIVLAWFELPRNSVFGVTGASFFGWLLSATAAPTRVTADLMPRPSAHVRMILLLACVMTPVFHIAFRSDLWQYQ